MLHLSDFRDYQHRALAFLRRQRRGYLAAKPGAGKTGVALALANEVLYDTFETSRVLVVAPKRVAQQWPSAAKGWAFAGHLRFATYLGEAGARAAALRSDHDVLCCSFEFFPELVSRIKAAQWPYGLVIFDEASRLRNGGRQGSLTWKAMNAVSAKTDARIVLMSGSPRPGTAHELFAPVFLLDRGVALGGTLTKFRTDYLEPNKQNRHTGQVYSWRLRAGMEEALYGRIQHLYYAVAPDLGLPSVTVDRWVALPDQVREMCETLQRDQVVDVDELDVTAPSQGNVAGKLHQMGAGAVFDDAGRVRVLHDEKIAEIEEILAQVDAPVIVGYWYSHERERLMARLPGAVDLGTEVGLAAALRGEVRVGLLHPGSAGHGIDGLQKWFSALIWMTLPGSYELYDQTCKRLIRSGQPETVTVFRVLADGAIVDQRIVERHAQCEAEQDDFFRRMGDAA